MNDAQGAAEAAHAATTLAPKSSAAWNTKGRAELSRKDYAAAIVAFTEALKLNPNNVWAKNNLGYAALLQGNIDDAVKYLSEATEQALKQHTATGYMFNNLGHALEHQGKIKQAIEKYQEAAKRHSKKAQANLERLGRVKTIAVTVAPTQLPVPTERNLGHAIVPSATVIPGEVEVRVEPSGHESGDAGHAGHEGGEDGHGHHDHDHDHHDHDHGTVSSPEELSPFERAQCNSPRGEWALTCARAAQFRWAEYLKAMTANRLPALRESTRSPSEK